MTDKGRWVRERDVHVFDLVIGQFPHETLPMTRLTLGSSALLGLSKRDLVPKWIPNRHLQHSRSVALLQSRSGKLVLFAQELLVVFLDACHHDPYVAARAGITVVLAEVENQSISRDLAVEGKVVFETM